MIPSLQPNRPTSNPRSDLSLSGQAQQVRHISSPQSAPQDPALRLNPRNQVEALPPNTSLTNGKLSSHVTTSIIPQAPCSIVPVFDASKRHPVFFTDRLKLPPTGVSSGGWLNPVAMGYVMNERIKRPGMGRL